MNEIRVIGTFLGSGSLDPNMWVLLPFLDPNIRTLLWWKYTKDVVIMWHAWQTWLTQPGKFNLQLQAPSWNYDPNIRMRLDPKKMVQHQVYTQILVLHIRVKWTHSLGSNDWYNTFGVIFRFKPRYLVQTWNWTLWYNQALEYFLEKKTPARLLMQITWPWPPVGIFRHGLITVRQTKMWT